MSLVSKMSLLGGWPVSSRTFREKCRSEKWQASATQRTLNSDWKIPCWIISLTWSIQASSVVEAGWRIVDVDSLVILSFKTFMDRLQGFRSLDLKAKMEQLSWLNPSNDVPDPSNGTDKCLMHGVLARLVRGGWKWPLKFRRVELGFGRGRRMQWKDGEQGGGTSYITISVGAFPNRFLKLRVKEVGSLKPTW